MRTTTIDSERKSNRTAAPSPKSSAGRHVLGETIFVGALIRERKRADRSNRPLGLLVVTLSANPAVADKASAIIAGLTAAKGETDMLGWLDCSTLGVIMPAVGIVTKDFASELEMRFRCAVEAMVHSAVAELIAVRLFVHSPRKEGIFEGRRELDRLMETLRPLGKRSLAYEATKRAVDLAGSLTLLALLSPVFAIVAALVKLRSPGPVFFRQERIGQGMKPFDMFKFRTMHVNADHAVHHDYMTSFIKANGATRDIRHKGLFKLTNDRRITPVGRFLRRTSMDELPQLWNVVRGEMSLVGPRPPLRYEVVQYEPWHCRRVLEAKPGITGLWQVKGRSRTTFDEMVRLDLRYAHACSLWTDVKILLATPAAVIAGKGAA
jgi:lipopolysaccharide/colanic/teichoic acid biosynthesis glycosyltransferase